MKPYSLLIIATVLFSACAGPSTEQKADSTAVSPESVAATTTAISTYVGDVDENTGDQYTLAVHDFTGSNNPSGIVATFNNNSRPLRLYLYPEGKTTGAQTETWLYLDSLSGKAVLLREVVASADSVTENSFYYSKDSLLQAETRSAKDLQALEDAAFRPYHAEGASAMAVDSLVKKLLQAVEADRKDLSKDANIIRKQGASHWATGNEPGWNLAVIPNKKILFNTNYGQDKFEFPCGSAQKGDKDATEFTAESKGHTLQVKFENKRCTDDASNVHPLSVTVTLDGKHYQGCGQSLY